MSESRPVRSLSLALDLVLRRGRKLQASKVAGSIYESLRLESSRANLTVLSGQDMSGGVRSTLLDRLFPAVRARVLQLLFTNPGTELYVRELARLSFLSLQTVQDELAKLEAAALIASRSNGYHRFYRANPKHPLFSTLRRLVTQGVSHAMPVIPARGKRGGGGARRHSHGRVR